MTDALKQILTSNILKSYNNVQDPIYYINTLTVLVLLVCAPHFGHAGLAQKLINPTPRLHIISIGINEYRKFSKLQYAVPDATLIADAFLALEPRANIVSQHLLLDATKNEILELISKVSATKRLDDTVVIYWAGLSTFDDESGTLFLAPVDAEQVKRKPISKNAIAFFKIVERFQPKDKVIFFGDGCYFGDGFGDKISLTHPKVAILTSSKVDEAAIDGLPSLGGSPFAYHLAKALRSPVRDIDLDTLVSVDELFIYLYPKVVQTSNEAGASQHPSLIGRYTHRAMLSKAQTLHKEYKFDQFSDFKLATADQLEVNGSEIQESVFDENAHALRLGENDKGIFRNGLNFLRNIKGKWLYWHEEGKLVKYESPYKRSHAIIVAIDDYNRNNDPYRRPKTGLTQLSGMVSRAQELGEALRLYGFEKIHYFFDEKATSDRIEAILRKYWIDEEFASVDRLVFYFGGHGLDFHDQTLLATYNYDSSRKVGSTFRALSLIREHSELIASPHALFLLDVCHAGLAVVGTLTDQEISDTAIDPKILKFKRLSAIRDDAEERSRNILVAGTANQEALWLNGGIFTKALITTLKGENEADANNDGVLQFHEYANKVRGDVSLYAATKGHRQKPSFKVLTS